MKCNHLCARVKRPRKKPSFCEGLAVLSQHPEIDQHIRCLAKGWQQRMAEHWHGAQVSVLRETLTSSFELLSQEADSVLMQLSQEGAASRNAEPNPVLHLYSDIVFATRGVWMCKVRQFFKYRRRNFCENSRGVWKSVPPFEFEYRMEERLEQEFGVAPSLDVIIACLHELMLEDRL